MMLRCIVSACPYNNQWILSTGIVYAVHLSNEWSWDVSGGKPNWIVLLPSVWNNWHSTPWPGLSLPCWKPSSNSAPSPSLMLVPEFQDALVSQPQSWVIFQYTTQENLTHEHFWNNHQIQCLNLMLKIKCIQIWNWIQEVAIEWGKKATFISRLLSTQSTVLRPNKKRQIINIPLSWGGGGFTYRVDLSMTFPISDFPCSYSAPDRFPQLLQCSYRSSAVV